jgi:hypothetical protein
MKKIILTVVILPAVLIMLGSPVSAATPQSSAPAATAAPAAATPPAPVKVAEPAHWHTMNNAFMDAFHNPFDGLQMGLDLRLRDEYNHNTSSLDDQFGDNYDNAAKEIKHGNWNEENGQRYRMRWSTIWTLSPDVTFNTRLVWEFWTWDTEKGPSRANSDQNLDMREMIFDRMNLTFKNAFDAPMTLVVGRQDIMLGTGWLVNDGTPRDGSRTMFFDALRATIDLRDKTQLDLIGITQYDDEETWLKPINHRDYLSLTQKTDETGFIGYLTDKSIKNTTLEGYYIYKKEEPSNYTKFWRTRSENWSTTPGRDQEIHTFGGRIAQKLDDNWSYSVEVAKQFGRKDMGTYPSHDNQSMKSLGSNDSLVYAFNDEWKNELRTTFEYLSGDKPGTKGSEAFDPLWGDWPQPQRGGDLVPNMYTYENAKGEVTNLYRLGFGHTFKPIKNWSFATDYNLLWADQNTKGDSGSPAGSYGSPVFTKNGNFRGQLFSWLATYSCCKNFKTSFTLDYFVPGNYYDQSTRDHAVFARVNLEWTF